MLYNGAEVIRLMSRKYQVTPCWCSVADCMRLCPACTARVCMREPRVAWWSLGKAVRNFIQPVRSVLCPWIDRDAGRSRRATTTGRTSRAPATATASATGMHLLSCTSMDRQLTPFFRCLDTRYTFYCKCHPGTKPYVADCAQDPDFRCFTRYA